VRAKQAGHFPLFNCPALTPHSSKKQHPWVKNRHNRALESRNW
jgi:hypothetical protein